MPRISSPVRRVSSEPADAAILPGRGARAGGDHGPLAIDDRVVGPAPRPVLRPAAHLPGRRTPREGGPVLLEPGAAGDDARTRAVARGAGDGGPLRGDGPRRRRPDDGAGTAHAAVGADPAADPARRR